jgi:hypothetical protein
VVLAQRIAVPPFGDTGVNGKRSISSSGGTCNTVIDGKSDTVMFYSDGINSFFSVYMLMFLSIAVCLMLCFQSP